MRSSRPASLRSPSPLAAGDRVRVVAPSSPFDAARLARGIALIGSRYSISEGQALHTRTGYLAGDDASRLADLQAALHDPRTRAIVPARGGYGATRLLPRLDPNEVAKADTWLVGFSDVTALHALWFRAGLRSVHGPMACSLAEADSELQTAWFSLLEGQLPAPVSGLRCARGGTASGILFGGNLAVLTALVGTPYLPALNNVILLLEDVGERPYRIDRMLTTLLQSGALADVRGVVLGQFTQCEPGADGQSSEAVLIERLSQLKVPLVVGAPVGHVDGNVPLLLGAQVELDSSAGTLAFL